MMTTSIWRQTAFPACLHIDVVIIGERLEQLQLAVRGQRYVGGEQLLADGSDLGAA
jgi:hypothetical protein